MNCINHPNRKAFSICQKYDQGYCEECCTCTDPKGYCKYRTRCIGWQICRKKQERFATEGTEITEKLAKKTNKIININKARYKMLAKISRICSIVVQRSQRLDEKDIAKPP